MATKSIGKTAFGEKLYAELKKQDIKLSHNETAAVIKTFLTMIKTITMEEGTAVTFTGFGKFEKRHIAAREGHNPQTGAQLQIPAHDKLAFKASKM